MATVLSPTSTKRVAFLPSKTSGLRIPGAPATRPRLAIAMRSSDVDGEASVETVAAKDVCKTCGVPLSEIPFGCDQSGRIQGGIGAVPGFRWWPIKAYRPCGKAAEAGVEYTRKGQGVDEVMFGRK